MDYKPGETLTGVEIGVFKGELLLQLLDLEPRISKVYRIDPYCMNSGYRRYKFQAKWDRLHAIVTKNMAQYGDRFTLIREKSENAFDLIPMVDFIEIDGLHTYEQVSLELNLYEKKVKSGGMFCGHDYFGPFRRPVRRAVRDYARAYGRRVLVGNEETGMWYWRVP
jgi:hypothetical protein